MTADWRPATLGASSTHNNRAVQAAGIALLMMVGLSACATPPYPRQPYMSGSIQAGALEAPRPKLEAKRPNPPAVTTAAPKIATAAATATNPAPERAAAPLPEAPIVAETMPVLETAAGPEARASEPAPEAAPITVSARDLDLPPPPPQDAIETASRSYDQMPPVSGSPAPAAAVADYQPPLDLFGNRAQPTTATVKEPALAPSSIDRKAEIREPAPTAPPARPVSEPKAEEPRSGDTGRIVAELSAPPPPQFAAAAVELPEDHPRQAVLNSLSIGFPALSDELTDRARSELALFAQQLNADAGSRIRLVTSSSGTGSEASVQRRLALTRLFKVRDYLIGQGVESERLRLVPANAGAPTRLNDTVALEIDHT